MESAKLNPRKGVGNYSSVSASFGEAFDSPHGPEAQWIEQLVVPTIVTDAAHRVVVWNRACEALTGMPAGRMLGTTEQWRAFYSAARPCLADLILDGRLDEIPALYRSSGTVLLNESGVAVENWYDLRFAMRRAYLAIDAGPVYGADGRLTAVVETLRAITAQKEAQDTLARLATVDALTGLANRRMFDRALDDASSRCGAVDGPLSLLMFDIDYFKDFNDRYGHCAGDVCLQRVAGVIARSVRTVRGVAARYGGEEFGIVLPGVDGADACAIAERLRDSVEALGIDHDASRVARTVTLSVGDATANKSARGLLARADAALYASKHQGRNRVSVATA